jgi:HSP20 family molecular chaperone IbpA
MDVHIAARTFELAYYVKVKGASLENGLLHVDLVARFGRR